MSNPPLRTVTVSPASRGMQPRRNVVAASSVAVVDLIIINS